MSRKWNRILSMVFTFFMIFSLFTCVFADASTKKDDNIANMKEILEPLIRITQVLLLVGAGVCIGKLIHIGILFVTSSAAEKSNAKMAMLPWVIGTFVCFGASTIGGFIIKILMVNKDVLSY